MRKTKFQVDSYVRARQRTKSTYRFAKPPVDTSFRGVGQIIWMTDMGKGPVYYKVDRSRYKYRASDLHPVTKQEALEYKLCHP
jgi:hypothetical protein